MKPPVPFSLYQSPLLSAYDERVIHGFTGKPNSMGGPDTPENPKTKVEKNREELAKQLGFKATDWLIPEQVHGHRIGRTGDKGFHKTDAILLVEPNKPVMLMYADCIPVLLYDPERHAGCVIHAGWRGTSQKIAAEGLLTLQNAVGSKPSDIVAVIGPGISLCCFQVSMDVVDDIRHAMDRTLDELENQKFLAWDEDSPHNPRLDLKGINALQLKLAGVTQIDILPACTKCDTQSLYSYRRKEDGRNGAYMMLKAGL